MTIDSWEKDWNKDFLPHFHELDKKHNTTRYSVMAIRQQDFIRTLLSRKEEEVRKEIKETLENKIHGYFEDEAWMEMRRENLLNWAEEVTKPIK